MQAVVLTTSVQAGQEPGGPESTCCQVKELGAPFTVPANQVTTVPLSLHASTGDGVGISLLTPNASTPLHATENPSDSLRFWAPALTAPTSSFEGPSGETVGYELAARFNFVPAPAGKGPAPSAPGGSSPGPAARSGVKLTGTTFRPGRDGRTLVLGKATNPPTARTTQKLTVPRLGSFGKKSKTGPIVLGTGRTAVPPGRSAPLRLALGSRGRATLAEGSFKAILTITATNPEGESQTITKAVTIKPALRESA